MSDSNDLQRAAEALDPHVAQWGVLLRPYGGKMLGRLTAMRVGEYGASAVTTGDVLPCVRTLLTCARRSSSQAQAMSASPRRVRPARGVAEIWAPKLLCVARGC